MGQDNREQSKKIQAFMFDQETFEFKVLDQTLLPNVLKYVEIKGTSDGFEAIKNMWVRGAPCIAAVACLSIVSELRRSAKEFDDPKELCAWLDAKKEYMISSRPTAVNLKQALDRLADFARANMNQNIEEVKAKLTKLCLQAVSIGLEANQRLGDYGAAELLKSRPTTGPKTSISILTHCNTGALATVGHGTALGVIRSLHSLGNLSHAYCTETRPYNQGSRLTAWELVTEGIPSTLIADSMVAYLMSSKQIDAVVVGADRVAANGDTANKIGTLQIAVLAKHYQVPFYVAAPTQSIDLETKDASAIVIEQRPPDELRRIATIQLAPSDINVWNPCFDVTPANLIAGIITELGVCKPGELIQLLNEKSKDQEDDALF